VPVWTRKWESDLCYEQMTRFVLQHPKSFRLALASHNLRSLAQGIAAAEILQVHKNDYEVQMLYGMADAEKAAMTKRGLRLRIYMPFGELIPGMAYLVRRLLENTSNDSFISSGLTEQAPIEELLKNPAENLKN
jgi:RHH-type proline utilization regulon transcriptional repressor/proline dehydrogenase/delta 1-pyrroline-5-carboxylate dehydrogenase